MIPSLQPAGRTGSSGPESGTKRRQPVAGHQLPPELIGVCVLAFHNVVVHRLLPAPADSVANLAIAVGLARFARRVGCSAADLGIRPDDAASGLRLGLVALEAFMGLVAATLAGFGVLFGVSYTGGHSVLLQTVLLARHGKKETMSPTALDFKNFHGCQTVPRHRGPP